MYCEGRSGGSVSSSPQGISQCFSLLTVSSMPSSERVHGDAAGSPPRAGNQQLLDLGDVVVGEKSLLSTESSCPPPGRVLFDDVNKVISVEAELVRVLSVVGVQSFALGHLGLGFGCRFGSSATRWRPAG